MPDAPRSIEELIEGWAPRLSRAFLDAIRRIASEVRISTIAELLERGDVDGALREVGLDPVAFRRLEGGIEQAFEDGGDFTMGRIPALRQPDGHRLNILFDLRNPRAEQWLREESSTLVREIVADQRVSIRQHLVAGMETGINPRTVALDLVGRKNRETGQREGGVIGLTAAQEGWVRSFSARLASGDPAEMTAALGMKLRDKRFDRTIAKAIREGTSIPAAKVADMVRAYRARALKHRGDAVGRTEALRALNASQVEAFEQAIEAGQVNEAAVTKVWHTAADERVRTTHRLLNGRRAGFRAVFVSPSGAQLRYPGDPAAPAAETVQCRCWMNIRINHLLGVR